MAINYNNLFDEIKSSVSGGAKAQIASGSFDKIIRFKRPNFGEPPLEYLFRILPYVKEGKEGLHKTFYHFVKYFWKDDLGQYQSVLSRKTFNEPCIISNYYYNIQNNGSQYEKEKLNQLNYRQGWYCNVYVINDPITPSNNGKVMVVALVKTLWKKVLSALNGELDDEWSARFSDASPDGQTVHINVGKMITDLSNSGVNFSVKVGNKGSFPDYGSSEFTRREAKLNLTDEQQEQLLNACIDPASLDREMSSEEIAKKFKETFLNQTSAEQAPAPKVSVSPNPVVANPQSLLSKQNQVDDDEIPGISDQPIYVKPAEPKPSPAPAINTEDDMDNFLKGWSDKDSKFDFS